MPKILFDTGWYEVEQSPYKAYRWCGPRSTLKVSGVLEEYRLGLNLFNNNPQLKNHDCKIVLKYNDNTEDTIHSQHTIAPKKNIKINIPLSTNLQSIVIESDFFVPSNSDTRQLSLMLTDIHLITKNNKNIKLFLSNVDNYKQVFLGNITNFIQAEQLTTTNQSLECVCLLATGKEYENGLYQHFIKQLSRASKESQDLAKNIDFIVISTSDNPLYDLTEPKKIFKSASEQYIKIKDTDNYYYSLDSKSQYGEFAGPNLVFFETILALQKYNTTLFLECDCFLSNNWISPLVDYVKYAGGFWISGAVCDGHNNLNIEHIVNQHNNGGICLYNTGNILFHNFIRFAYDLLPTYIEYYNTKTPYDFFIKQIIDYHFNEDKTNRKIWQFIRRQYVFNNLLTNYSTVNDINESTSCIFNTYKCSIIHKKPFLICK